MGIFEEVEIQPLYISLVFLVVRHCGVRVGTGHCHRPGQQDVFLQVRLLPPSTLCQSARHSLVVMGREWPLWVWGES